MSRIEYSSDTLGQAVKDAWKNARAAHESWRQEARVCYDMVAGHQWTDYEESELKAKDRIPVKFNRIQKYVNALVGLQINNRQEIRYLPRETSDNRVAELLTEAVRWADDLCEGEDEVTDAFEDMAVCGMGWTDTRMDYKEDPKGLVKTAERIDPIEMEWDPLAKKRNLSDACWKAHGKNWDWQEAEERWPQLAEAAGPAELDDDMPVLSDTEEWNYVPGKQSGSARPKKVLIVRIQWYEDRKVMYLVDPDNGELTAVARNRFSKIKELFMQLYGIELEGVSGTERKYYEAFAANSTVLEKHEMSCKKFTLQAMCANRDRNKNIWYGIVRAQIDPQKFSNKFFSDFAYIISTNRKGGAFVETSALVDPKKAERDWASPDSIIEVEDGALARGAIRERDAGTIPAGVDRLMSYAAQVMPDISGVSAELMGQVDRNQPGILEEQRKESAVSMLGKFFDALKRHSRSRGHVVMEYIIKYLNDGRIIRISDPMGKSKPAALNFPEDITMDIVVDEAQTTSNSKRQTLGVVLNLLPHLQAMQVPVPPSIIEYLPLPSTLIEEWKQLLAPKPDQENKNPLAEAEAVKGQFELQKEQMRQQPKMLDLQLKQQKQQNDVSHELKRLIHEEVKIALQAAALELERGKLEVDAAEAGVRLALDEYSTLRTPKVIQNANQQ